MHAITHAHTHLLTHLRTHSTAHGPTHRRNTELVSDATERTTTCTDGRARERER